MTDPTPDRGSFMNMDIDAAMAALDKERRRLDDISKARQEETTTVQAKDHSLEMTFDGSGELTDLKFNGTKYRSMPPAQLASVIVQTLNDGRAQSMAKLTDLVSSDIMPGVDLAGIASGKVDPSSVLDQLISPLNALPDDTEQSGKDGRNG